jgi:hypothetical protein
MPSERTVPAPGYETQDAKPRPLIYFTLSMAVLLGLSALAAQQAFVRFRPNASVPPFANVRPLPPPPRLQATPFADIEQYQRSQHQILNSYGWVDRQQGIVRIPIDRAMQLLLQRGLPVRQQGAAVARQNKSNEAQSPRLSAGGTQETQEEGTRP